MPAATVSVARTDPLATPRVADGRGVTSRVAVPRLRRVTALPSRPAWPLL